MSKTTVSTKTLRFLTEYVLEMVECDYLDARVPRDRETAMALHEAIFELEMQDELDAARERENLERLEAWKKQQAEKGAN